MNSSKPSRRSSLGIKKSELDTKDDFVGDFGSMRPKHWKDMKLTQYSRRDPNTGLVHNFLATKSEVSDNVLHVGVPKKVEPDAMYDYCLALRSKQTGRIVEYRPVGMLNMGPKYAEDAKVFLGERDMEKMDLQKDFTDSKKSFMEKRRSLLSQFGSAKRKKLLKEQEKREETANAQSEESLLTGVAGGIVNFNALLDVSEKRKKLEAHMAGRSGPSVILPPYDPNPPTVSQVYKLTDFISSEELNNYRAEGEGLTLKTLAELRTDSTVCVPMVNHIAKYGWPKDEEKKITKAIYLFYINALVGVNAVLGAGGKLLKSDNFSALKIPKDMEKKILDLFTEPMTNTHFKQARYEMSRVDRDRLKAHVLAMVLLLQGLSFEMSPWALALSTTPLVISQIARTLGCKTESNRSAASTATLVGPPGNVLAEKKTAPKRKR